MVRPLFGKSKRVVKILDINDISINIPLIGKIFKYGTLSISEEKEIKIFYLKKAQELRSSINLIIRRKKEIF